MAEYVPEMFLWCLPQGIFLCIFFHDYKFPFFKHQWHELSACVVVNELCAVVLPLPGGNYCT